MSGLQNGAILSLEDVSRHFGGVRAVDGVSMSVRRGAIHGLIGPNGAGKTTLFNLIAGAIRPQSGKIVYDGANVAGWRPNQAALKGVGRTFQNLRLFRKLSVLENVMVGLTSHARTGLGLIVLGLASARAEEQELRNRGQAILAWVGLAGREAVDAGTLPYGQQRILEIARALALNPRLLLLDEPGAGMNHEEKLQLIELIRAVRDRGITVLLVEHNMPLISEVSDYVTVLSEGRILAEGPPAEALTNPAVVEAYLGGDL